MFRLSFYCFCFCLPTNQLLVVPHPLRPWWVDSGLSNLSQTLTTAVTKTLYDWVGWCWGLALLLCVCVCVLLCVVRWRHQRPKSRLTVISATSYSQTSWHGFTCVCFASRKKHQTIEILFNKLENVKVRHVTWSKCVSKCKILFATLGPVVICSRLHWLKLTRTWSQECIKPCWSSALNFKTHTFLHLLISVCVSQSHTRHSQSSSVTVELLQRPVVATKTEKSMQFVVRLWGGSRALILDYWSRAVLWCY